jgi:ketosteroid isomerase-like protein
VELVRALQERWNEGDRSAASIAEHCDPTVELTSPFSSVLGKPYRGYAGIEQWMRDIDEQFAEWRYSLDDVREAGGAVATIGTHTGRGRASGIAIEVRAASVLYFGSDGRITRVSIYPDVDQALKAVGLEE